MFMGGGAQYLLVHRITVMMQLIFLRSFTSKLGQPVMLKLVHDSVACCCGENQMPQ